MEIRVGKNRKILDTKSLPGNIEALYCAGENCGCRVAWWNTEFSDPPVIYCDDCILEESYNAEICQRCSSELIDGFCTDETCPFSDHEQVCGLGWSGHPEHDCGVYEPCSCERW